jgi:hypothetical protein
MSCIQRRARPAAEQIYVLVPYDPRKAMSIHLAAERAGKSASNLRNWCETYGIGRRIGNGHWEVSRIALQMFMDGDTKALAHISPRGSNEPNRDGVF